MATKLSEEIELLLEHYLRLVDQYDTLRSQLSNVQSSLHQHLARANFEADRGIRYSADLYDARMQASRLCRVTIVPETGTTLFTISAVESHEEKVSPKDDEEGQGLREEEPHTTSTEKEATNGEEREGKEEATKTTTPKPKDPIRMFGILTPPSLRIAQSKAVETVLHIIPKLASLDSELKDVEIRIRRARKHKAKAEAMKTKQAQQAEREDESLAEVAEAAENAIEEKPKVSTKSSRDTAKKSSDKNFLATFGLDVDKIRAANAAAIKDRESAPIQTSLMTEARARFEQWNMMLAGMTCKLHLLRRMLKTAIARGPTTAEIRIIASRSNVIDAEFVELWESMREFLDANWRFRNQLSPLSEDSLTLIDEFAAAWKEVQALFVKADAITKTPSFCFYLGHVLWVVVLCTLVYANLNYYGLC